MFKRYANMLKFAAAAGVMRHRDTVQDKVSKAQFCMELVDVWNRPYLIGGVLALPLMTLFAIGYGIFKLDLAVFGMGILGTGFTFLFYFPLTRYAIELRNQRLENFEKALNDIFSNEECTKHYYFFEAPRNWEKVDPSQIAKRLRGPFIMGWKCNTKYIPDKGNMLIKLWFYNEPAWDGLWFVS